MEYFSFIKTEILTLAITQMNLENTLSKINKAQKDKYYMIPFI
jgi:hypothetical protein